MTSKPRIMFLVAADYASLKAKHVDSMIFERDEFGFFERVVTVHPLGLEDTKIEFSSVHALYEMHLKFRSATGFKKIGHILTLPFFLVKTIRKLIKIINQEKINIIRSVDPFWMGLLGFIISKIKGLPFCISIHTDYDLMYKLKVTGNSYTLLGSRFPTELLSKFILRQADFVFPIRDSLAKWAINKGVKSDSIRVFPHGIDFAKFNTFEKYNNWLTHKITNKKIISFVGRLSKENYVYQLPEIIKALAQKRDDFVFVIAGDGNLFSFLESKIEKNITLKRHMILLGFQEREKCFELRRQSEVCLCLMGGYSLIEACAAARPVISYDVDWHYELVINNITGYLIEENNIDQVVNSLNKLLSNKEQTNNMGNMAFQLVKKKHDIQHVTQLKRKYYSELL